MKIPKTTPEKPYIEFRINKKGEIRLLTSDTWWGGINSGFSHSDGYEGNTCKPKDLIHYLENYKIKKLKELKKEILDLQKRIEKLNKINTQDYA